MAAFIAPYKAGSKSAKRLAEELGIKRIKKTNSAFKGGEDKVVINWGNSKLSEEVLKCRVINDPEKVKVATNKKLFFELIHHKTYSEGLDVNIPGFTTSKRKAQDWLDRGYKIVERHKLTGHSGDGIKIKSEGEAVEDCNLYVQYIPKKSEWRVHVVAGKVILVQRKARKRDVPDEQVNWQVRNHDNGFVFARNEGGEPPRSVTRQAVRVVRACGLDFGAVDLVYNERQETAYVLEVNTACGMEGSTLDDYANAFRQYGLLEPLTEEQPQEVRGFAPTPPMPVNAHMIHDGVLADE